MSEVAESPIRAVSGRAVLRVRGTSVERRDDRLVGEEPLEIRVAGPGQASSPVSIAITMRTPGREDELATGFLLTEGLVRRDEILGFELGDAVGMAHPDNEVTVRLGRDFTVAEVPSRLFVATASCGLCGKTSIDQVAQRCERLPAGRAVGRSALIAAPDALREAQALFESTGGIHAAGLFDHAGRLLLLREDVGRHNALDKAIGAMALAGRLPLHDVFLLVSGRVSFELVQKAAMAGIPLVAAVSAPTDLAVETAGRLGMTLVGFLRGDGFNVYTGAERVDLDG